MSDKNKVTPLEFKTLLAKQKEKCYRDRRTVISNDRYWVANTATGERVLICGNCAMRLQNPKSFKRRK